MFCAEFQSKHKIKKNLFKNVFIFVLSHMRVTNVTVKGR